MEFRLETTDHGPFHQPASASHLAVRGGKKQITQCIDFKGLGLCYQRFFFSWLLLFHFHQIPKEGLNTSNKSNLLTSIALLISMISLWLFSCCPSARILNAALQSGTERQFPSWWLIYPIYHILIWVITKPVNNIDSCCSVGKPGYKLIWKGW